MLSISILRFKKYCINSFNYLKNLAKLNLYIDSMKSLPVLRMFSGSHSDTEYHFMKRDRLNLYRLSIRSVPAYPASKDALRFPISIKIIFEAGNLMSIRRFYLNLNMSHSGNFYTDILTNLIHNFLDIVCHQVIIQIYL